MTIYTGRFWAATFERVASTALQAAIPTITVASLDAIDWGAAVSITGAAALLALVKAVISGLQSGSPGLGTAEVLAAKPQVTTGERHDEPPSRLDRMDQRGAMTDAADRNKARSEQSAQECADLNGTPGMVFHPDGTGVTVYPGAKPNFHWRSKRLTEIAEAVGDHG